jgi:hypothetical protein
MSAGSLLRTPRPLPARRLPIVAAAATLALALPVFLVADWPVGGWALATVLWAAGQGFGLLLQRQRLGADNLGGSGVVGFAMMFRAVAVMVVLVAVAASNTRLGVSAAVLYALAYSLELGLSVVAYFSGSPR